MTMAETNIYANEDEIPELAYYVQFVGINSSYTDLIQIPTDGSNMYNLADGTWSVYEPSTSGTVSADISWGSLAFTYTDGENGADGAWTADAAEGATMPYRYSAKLYISQLHKYSLLNIFDDFNPIGLNSVSSLYVLGSIRPGS